MPTIGWFEILIVVVVAIVVIVLVILLFGRGKISSLMGDVAKGIKSFKKGMSSDTTDEDEPKNISEDNQDTNNKE